MINIQQINYCGWQNCYRLTNETIELIVTCDVGPRIIHFGFVRGENEFAVFAGMLGKTGGDKWRVYGGHRFWHAPEHPVRTYLPDNVAVQFEEHDGFVRLIQQQEAATGLVKEIDICLHPQKAKVQVTHRLLNHSLWGMKVAPWALSVMAADGVGIVPMPARGTHPKNLLPNGNITLWPYTDMSDPRWTWGRAFILLRQEPSNPNPQKVGVYAPAGWAAYARGGHLFVKQFEVDAKAEYPDLNSMVALFTNGEMLEVETLGALVDLMPANSESGRRASAITHSETWTLLANVPQPSTEQEVVDKVMPRIQALKGE